MINFDNIENSLRREIADDNGDGSCDLTNTALLELITLLRHAEKDAARYCELRDAESETCLEFINAKARAASPEWLDGLVDEYMKCSN